MSVTAFINPEHEVDTLQFVTFYVGESCLALPIGDVREIIRDVSVRQVPIARREIRGVINLRGDVTTVIDLHRVLGIGKSESGRSQRTLIVRSQTETFGLMVDGVADIITTGRECLLPPPGNVGEIARDYFRGICCTDSELVAVLDLEAVLLNLNGDSA